MLTVYSGQGEEYERKAKDKLFSIANSRKAREGGLAGLQDPALLARKRAEEKALREPVAANPDLKDAAGAWDTIAKVQKVRANNIKKYTMIEGAAAGFNTPLF